MVPAVSLLVFLLTGVTATNVIQNWSRKPNQLYVNPHIGSVYRLPVAYKDPGYREPGGSYEEQQYKFSEPSYQATATEDEEPVLRGLINPLLRWFNRRRRNQATNFRRHYRGENPDFLNNHADAIMRGLG